MRIDRALILMLVAAACLEAPPGDALDPAPDPPPGQPLMGLWAAAGREDRFFEFRADGTVDLLSWPVSGEPLLVDGTYVTLDHGIVELAWGSRVDSATFSADPDVLVLIFADGEQHRLRSVGPEIWLSPRQRRHMASSVYDEVNRLVNSMERCHRERGSTYVGCDERLLEGRASIRVKVSGQTTTDYEILATEPWLGDLADSHPCRYRHVGGERPGVIVCALAGIDGELRYRVETGRLRARFSALRRALEACRERVGSTYEGCDERLVTVPTDVSLEVSEQATTGYLIRGTAGDRPRVLCSYRHDAEGQSRTTSCMRSPID